jgi:hypothetical protein
MEVVPVKAYIPRDLRRRAFSQLAIRDMTFSGWVRAHLTQWLAEACATPMEGQRVKPELEDGGARSRAGCKSIAMSLGKQPQASRRNRKVGA